MYTIISIIRFCTRVLIHSVSLITRGIDGYPTSKQLNFSIGLNCKLVLVSFIGSIELLTNKIYRLTVSHT